MAATREVFTYSSGLKTTTYFTEPGVAGERTESVLDEAGREVSKRYYRTDGSQYGEESVSWRDDGTQAGWDFRYTSRDGGASFRYDYQSYDDDGSWTRRLRYRNSEAARLEVRTTLSVPESTLPTSAIFAPGTVSTALSESSPSFSADGRTMVFARYEEDWDRKTPFLARLTPDGWQAERLRSLGTVYNLSLSPTAETIVFARREGSETFLFRTMRTSTGWSEPEDLSRAYGISGGYAHLSPNGELTFFNAEGSEGPGVYRAESDGDGFAPPIGVFTPDQGTAFDPFVRDDGSVLVSWCVDDVCDSGPTNGVWEVPADPGDSAPPRKLPGLPYVWGINVVESLNLVVFTDGDDIRALPLRLARD